MIKEKHLIMLALMLSATAGLIYEITATNLLFFYFVESSYSMATVISVFLLGLGIGSLLVYKYKERIDNRRNLFGMLQIIIGVYAIFALTNLEKIIPQLSTFGLFLSSFLILLIPTICLGAIFPLAGEIISKNKGDIGLIYSIDLIGAVIGSLIAGFYLIPLLGNRGTILFAVILNFGSAILSFEEKKGKIMGILFILLASFFLASTQTNITWNIIKGLENNFEINNSSEAPTPFPPQPHPQDIIRFEKSSPYGEIKLQGETLFIDGREQCSLLYGNGTGERKVVTDSLKPLNSRDLEVLNIGLGCGLSLEEILENVDKTVDIVEINSVVVEANRLLTDVLENERVNLIISEGFDYLRKTEKIYDSIIIDIENPSVIHSSNIYTKESFEILEKRLKAGGTFGLWVVSCNNTEYYDTIYYTLKESFNYVYQTTNEIFISSDDELDYNPYTPTIEKQVNTIDKKILSNVYFDNCKWWAEDTHIIPQN